MYIHVHVFVSVYVRINCSERVGGELMTTPTVAGAQNSEWVIEFMCVFVCIVVLWVCVFVCEDSQLSGCSQQSCGKRMIYSGKGSL